LPELPIREGQRLCFSHLYQFVATTQIRRASASLPANVSEGYGRKSRKEYIHFLYVAQGSLKEVETHLLLSQRVQLASETAIDPILTQCESVGKLLRGLIRALENKQ